MNLDPELKIELLKNDLEIKDEKIRLLQETIDEQHSENYLLNEKIRQINDDIFSSSKYIEENFKTQLKFTENEANKKMREYEELLEKAEIEFKEKLDSEMKNSQKKGVKIKKLKSQINDAHHHIEELEREIDLIKKYEKLYKECKTKLQNSSQK